MPKLCTLILIMHFNGFWVLMQSFPSEISFIFFCFSIKCIQIFLNVHEVRKITLFVKDIHRKEGTKNK